MSSRLLYSKLGKELADQLDAICKEALVIWGDVHLRTFTAHGKLHIEQVEANLDALTFHLQKSDKQLTTHEIFILLAACYLHDIGMQLGRPDAREKHAEYAYELILNSHARHDSEKREVTLPIMDPNARQAIAQVARGHWISFALQLKPKDTIMANEEGRLRLLGLLLATADLLDLSPVRATYFQTIHKLDKLNGTAELHQTKHERVKGFRIVAPDAMLQEELQYQLAWYDNSGVTRMISDWVLHEVCAQLRIVKPDLERDSSGRIRWAKDCVRVEFRPAAGRPVPELSQKAFNVLRAERASQLRINRNKFTQDFGEAMQNGDAAIFRFPSDLDIDGKPVVEWCQTHAQIADTLQVARVDIQLSSALDQASIIALILEQWKSHLTISTDEEALRNLKSFAETYHDKGLVLILVTESDYNRALLEPIINAIICRPRLGLARIALLLTPGADGPEAIGETNTFVCEGHPFSREDVVQHLQSQWGLNENESSKTYSNMEHVGLINQPQRVYDYINCHLSHPGDLPAQLT